MKRALTAAAAAAAAALAIAPAATPASPAAQDRDESRPFTYAVIGDTPYGSPQIANFPNDIAQINADRDVSLVMHLGDIKNGSSVCSDDYFNLIRSDFDGFTKPLVYTPGDNEWTDCHRANNGSYNPLERLAKLRSVFFPTAGRTLGAPKRVQAQRGATVENVRWERGDVVFGTVNVPGSNNSWLPWTGQTTQTPEQAAEYTSRNAANLRWINGIFNEAADEHAKAVVIGIQADMWDPAFLSDTTNAPSQYDHFTDTVRLLAARAKSFRKPVLLLNGDSHAFTDDRPLADPSPSAWRTAYGVPEVPNLRRITVNGSTTPCHEYVRLAVDTSAPGVFTPTRVRYANQPGFSTTVCPVG